MGGLTAVVRIPRITEHVLPVGTLPHPVLLGPSQGPNLMSDPGRDDDDSLDTEMEAQTN